ncbi:MAG TPA: hypothetical protein VFJ43_05030 [Bacteroidia bacterium]|nr:hypothetical protein [Bacteroidia bacterium]
MKNKFLSISIGITMMLLGAGFFVRSISSANAAPANNIKYKYNSVSDEAYVPLGISNGYGYFITVRSSGASYDKVALTEFGE